MGLVPPRAANCGVNMLDAAEQVVLVNAEGQEIGTGLKYPVHRSGCLHRAFSIFVFDAEGDLLLQQRSASKYHSPGLWSNTCCGHPRPGEATAAAAHRRLREEMGFDCDLAEVSSMIYRAEFENGMVEHEYDHVLIGHHDGPPTVNPVEVADWKAVQITTLIADLSLRPAAYTYWLKIILLDANQAIPVRAIRRLGPKKAAAPGRGIGRGG